DGRPSSDSRTGSRRWLIGRRPAGRRRRVHTTSRPTASASPRCTTNRRPCPRPPSVPWSSSPPLPGAGRSWSSAVGTGRLALPLVQRGFVVHGIDASPAMVARLRAKPGGDRVTITMGDFADLAVAGRFSLIFVAFNTFFGLLTQEAQIRCFAGIAEHLTDDGRFVLEAFVP